MRGGYNKSRKSLSVKYVRNIRKQIKRVQFQSFR